MASTIIEVVGIETGRTGLLLKLSDHGADTLLNAGGDALTENTNIKGVYTCTVTEAIAGDKRVTIYESDGTTLVGAGRIDIADDAGPYRVVDDGGGSVEIITQS